MIKSLQRHHKSNYKLFVLCLDEITRILLDKMNFTNVTTIPLHIIELRDNSILNSKYNRSLIEYYWTLTPCLIDHLLDCIPDKALITYLDADQMFFNSIDPLYDDISQSSIYIQPHRFPENLSYLSANGNFNVGLLSFRNDSIGKKAVTWWKNCCLEWCYDYIDGDRYGDQKYLDKFPTLFDNITISSHIGIGVAPWNHSSWSFSQDQTGKILINNKNLILYHFHSYELIDFHNAILTKHHYPFNSDVINLCYVIYTKKLISTYNDMHHIFRNFNFGLFNKILVNKPILTCHKTEELIKEDFNLLFQINETWSLCIKHDKSNH